MNLTTTAANGRNAVVLMLIRNGFRRQTIENQNQTQKGEKFPKTQCRVRIGCKRERNLIYLAPVSMLAEFIKNIGSKVLQECQGRGGGAIEIDNGRCRIDDLGQRLEINHQVGVDIRQ